MSSLRSRSFPRARGICVCDSLERSNSDAAEWCAVRASAGPSVNHYGDELSMI